ncbi:MAG: hypothetical protein HYU55_18320 [Nocardioides sp.]|nr:hypothetical protein [Nocardioides sp.]
MSSVRTCVGRRSTALAAGTGAVLGIPRTFLAARVAVVTRDVGTPASLDGHD